MYAEFNCFFFTFGSLLMMHANNVVLYFKLSHTPAEYTYSIPHDMCSTQIFSPRLDN